MIKDPHTVVMKNARQVFLPLAWCALLVIQSGVAAAREINPYPRAVIKAEQVLEWTFQKDTASWTAAHDCVLSNAGGALCIQSSGGDPYLIGPPMQVDGPVLAQLRLRCAAGGNGQIFWSTPDAPEFNEPHSEHFHLIHDNLWHDYTVALPAEGTIQRLRLDPAEGPGQIEVKYFRLLRQTLHPLEIQSVHTEGAKVTAKLKNYDTDPMSFTMNGRPFTLGAGASGEFSQIAPGKAPFRAFDIAVEFSTLPSLHRVVEVIDSNASADWASLKSSNLVVQAARDGSGARLELGGRLIGVLAPLISRDGPAPKFKLSETGTNLIWRNKG